MLPLLKIISSCGCGRVADNDCIPMSIDSVKLTIKSIKSDWKFSKKTNLFSVLKFWTVRGERVWCLPLSRDKKHETSWNSKSSALDSRGHKAPSNCLPPHIFCDACTRQPLSSSLLPPPLSGSVHANSQHVGHKCPLPCFHPCEGDVLIVLVASSETLVFIICQNFYISLFDKKNMEIYPKRA